MLRRFPDIGGALASHPLLRAIFPASLALIVVALAAVAIDMAWLVVVALVLSAALDGVLRMTPVSRGRLLREIRDRSSQLTTVRVGLAAAALIWVADRPWSALVVGAGLVLSVLCRVAAGWLQAYATRAGWDSAVGKSAAGGIGQWLGRSGIGPRYVRWLVATELTVIAALALALLGAGDGIVLTLAALAWAPSAELVIVAAWRWLYTVRHLPKLSPDVIEPVGGRVAVYFADSVSRAYQLDQWLPILDDLHRDLGVLVVFRDRPSFDRFGELTDLPRVYARTLDNLMALYAAGDHGVVLYVNNSMRNFQSLSWPRAMHVHINHGESDKTSLVTSGACIRPRPRRGRGGNRTDESRPARGRCVLGHHGRTSATGLRGRRRGAFGHHAARSGVRTHLGRRERGEQLQLG